MTRVTHAVPRNRPIFGCISDRLKWIFIVIIWNGSFFVVRGDLRQLHLNHLIVEAISVRPLISCCTATGMLQKALRDSSGEDWPENLVLWSIIGIDSVGESWRFCPPQNFFDWSISLTSSFSTNFHDATENSQTMLNEPLETEKTLVSVQFGKR